MQERSRDAQPQCHIHIGFLLAKKPPVSTNIAFKGKKVLSTEAVAPNLTALQQSHLCPPAGGSEPALPGTGTPALLPRTPAATRPPRAKKRSPRLGPHAAPTGADSRGGAVPHTNFPLPQRLGPTRGWTDDGRHWHRTQGSDAEETSHPAPGPTSKEGASGSGLPGGAGARRGAWGT